MQDVWVVADAIVSPLGRTSDENFDKITQGVSGVSIVNDHSLSSVPVAVARIAEVRQANGLTRFETLCLDAISEVLRKFSPSPDRTIFILSTTKGNIRLLEEGDDGSEKLSLHQTAERLAKKAGLKKTVVVSNACISGVMALIVAKRFLQSGQYDHALVVGADELSRFVVSGFQSLHALSDERCKPFDAARKGINLGEAAAAMLVSIDPSALKANPAIRVDGFGLTNDANHISGPSRTGEELSVAIQQALKLSNVSASAIDFVSAHGTATLYNDEMESKAFALSGLSEKPVNSLKAYYGHTLGAAGVLETVLGIHSLLNNTLIPSLGYESVGVSIPLNVIREATRKPLKTFLKTASGFGGCNAAIVLQKINQDD